MKVFNRIILPLWCKCWIAVTAASNRLENFLVWFVGVCCNAADGGTFSKVSFVAIVSSVESKVFRVKFDKNSILSRVFLQRQIWIVNYYVRKSVRKSVFPVHFGISIHDLSWRQQKQCLFSLLRFSDELSVVIIDNPY